MKTLESLKSQFNSQKLPKADYIKEMYGIHQTLFDYSNFIGHTDIEKIEITDHQVIVTTREAKLKVICPPQDHRAVPMEILNFNVYEKQDLDMMLALMEDGFSFFDIGANFGWYSMNFEKKFKNLKISAFEPIPKTFASLKKNLELNDLKKIQLFNFGFSNKEEELVFYFYPEGSGNASLANLSERNDVEKVTCQVKRLDDFMKATPGKVDFIKCDVEGAELFVFQGGVETLKEQKPIVFTEMLRKWAKRFNYHPNEIIKLFTEIGYSCFVAKSNRLQRFSEMTELTEETNFFFLHSEKHSAKIRQLSN